MTAEPFTSEFWRELPEWMGYHREHDPVRAVTLPRVGMGAYLVTRHADVDIALRGPDYLKDPRNIEDIREERGLPGLPFPRKELHTELDDQMSNNDPPTHSRKRGLAHKAFRVRDVETLRPWVRELVESMLDKTLAAPECEFLADFAFPFPMVVIGRLIGVPDADFEPYRELANTMIEHQRGPAVDKARAGMKAFLRDLIQRRREQPENDLLSALIEAEEEGERLTESELVAMLNLLLLAGHETTQNLITNGLLAFIDHPEQYELLRADPSLLHTATEELLRWVSPFAHTQRFTKSDVKLSGCPVSAGEPMVVSIVSANRDPAVFDEPESFLVDREPNPHIAFGRGIHFCLGASLARIEIQEFLSALIERVEKIELTVDRDTLTWRPGVFMRSLSELPVRLVRSAR
ncbi:cytochrome P450 [Amycolatopsis sp. NPDC059657]|uniref:cytochrome P450 family protein n=1 Tax=Amycolatopsis sp. NPDC059657 TaxID=3346899 RepID=UPI00366EB439